MRRNQALAVLGGGVFVLTSLVTLRAQAPGPPPAPPSAPGAPAVSPPQPAPGTPACPAPEPGKPRPVDQRTRLRLEVFQLVCPAAGFSRLAPDALGTAACEEVLARLGELGKARLLYRFNTECSMTGQVEFVAGSRGGQPRVRQGPPRPVPAPSPFSASPEEGLITAFTGSWTDTPQGQLCQVSWTFDCVTFPPSGAEEQDEGGGPGPSSFRLTQPISLRSGAPVAILVNQPSGVGTGTADILALLVRVEASRPVN
jgi:hypothetical protein